MTSAPQAPMRALHKLLDSIGLDATEIGGAVSIRGDDPVVKSPHRLGAASAAALLAQAVGVATIWRLRSGRTQNVSIDIGDAVDALHCNEFVELAGYKLPGTRDPINGLHRAGDGRWIIFQAYYPWLRDATLDLLNCPPTAAAIAVSVAHWNAEELETACADRGVAAAMVRTPTEWNALQQGKILAGQPVIQIDKIGNSPPEPFGPAERPLSGLRVLDLTHVLAGPALTRTLAEQGADVLHISSPTLPRSIGITLETGSGKRSAYLDLNRPEDSAHFSSLAREADIFVQSFGPGSLERRGFSPAKLAAARPGLIYVSVSCYGAVGPWSSRGGFDPQGQAAVGIMATEGTIDNPQQPPTNLLNDYLTAYLGAAGALAALLRRARDGGSYHVQVALAKSAMWVQQLGLLPRDAEQQPRDRPRLLETRTVFGPFVHLAPPLVYSDTKAYWEIPPGPLSADRAEWLTR